MLIPYIVETTPTEVTGIAQASLERRLDDISRLLDFLEKASQNFHRTLHWGPAGLAGNPIWNRFEPEREAIRLELAAREQARKDQQHEAPPDFIENEPPEAIAPVPPVLIVDNEIGKPWSDYFPQRPRATAHNPELRGVFPARTKDMLVQHRLKDKRFEYGFILRRTPKSFVVQTDHQIYVRHHLLYPVKEGDAIIRVYLGGMGKRARPKPGAYTLPDLESVPEEPDSEEEIIAPPVPVAAEPEAAPELPVPEIPAEPKIPVEPVLPFDDMPNYPSGDESVFSKDWDTDVFTRRIANLRRPYGEDEPWEVEEILPTTDPDFAYFPPPLPKDPQARENWSFMMVGVGIAFLLIANYLPT